MGDRCFFYARCKIKKYDDLIKKYSLLYRVPAPLIKAMVRKESNGDPDAESSAGAIGLMQILPRTANPWLLSKADLYEPAKNIGFGVFYVRLQFNHFSEIPDPVERWKFALASYNGGRGYVNRALQLARKFEDRTIDQAGDWQVWTFAKEFLKRKQCTVFGRRPDWRQIVDYVYTVITWSNVAADTLLLAEGPKMELRLEDSPGPRRGGIRCRNK